MEISPDGLWVLMVFSGVFGYFLGRIAHKLGLIDEEFKE